VSDISPATPRRYRSPSAAAILSFFWPGLGQLYLRRRWAAAVFAAPVLVMLAILAYEARRGPEVMVARMLEPSVAAAVLVAFAFLGLWRVASVLHAFSTAHPHKKHMADRLAASGLTIAIVATHVLGSYFLWSAYEMDLGIFGSDNAGDPGTDPGSNGRVTVLFAGLDAYSSRSESLYDSLMVVSVDTAKNRIAMVSVPRDTAGYPLYFGGTGKPKINSIPTYVRNGWIDSPDQPLTTLVKEVGYLVGIPINYYAVVDLGSFVTMIDAVGGIDIVNPSEINDPVYDFLYPDGHLSLFHLAAGPQHLDGRLALAYVRSRHGTGNSDYARAGRQQQLLVAIGRKMATPAMFARLPELMRQAGSLVKTNFPSSRVADMVDFGQSVPAANFDKYVLGPPYSVSTAKSGASTSCLKLDKVATLSIQLFGADSRYYGKTQAPTC
jgi:polyisoprenyl-teichoic acid--peptidoglycan teichoic acid transferase